MNNKNKNFINNSKVYTEISRIGRLSKKLLFLDKAAPKNTSFNSTKLNEYQSQHLAKKYIKYFYGLSEKTLDKHIKAFKKISTISDVSFICLIERRLDVIVYRLGFARSIYEARRLIKSNYIKVNESYIKDPNYIVDIGALISTNSLISYIALLWHNNTKLIKLPTHLYAFSIFNNKKPTEHKELFINLINNYLSQNILKDSNIFIKQDGLNKEQEYKLTGLLIKNPNEKEITYPNVNYKLSSKLKQKQGLGYYFSNKHLKNRLSNKGRFYNRRIQIGKFNNLVFYKNK